MEDKWKNRSLKRLYLSDIDKAPKVIHKDENGKEVKSPSNLYGRLLRVSHSTRGDNGAMLSAFEQRALTDDPGDTLGRTRGHPVYRSDDDGKTWRLIARVTDAAHPDYHIYWMPTLYELPRALGAYPAGTLLLGGATVDQTEGSWIRLYVSLDTGETWTALGDLDHGGFCGLGVWEPFFSMQGDGALVCHYCDERTASLHSQKLICRETRDLQSWTLARDTVALSDISLRPGMPVVTRLPDNRYFMVYEMVGMEGNPVYCRYSRDGRDWGDPRDPGRPVCADNGAALGSSPYCLWVNRGGEKGLLIVSGAFMSAGHSDTGSDYLVSGDLGETFTTWPHPVPYSQEDHVSHNGYSNSFLFDDRQNRLYAICNRGTQDGCTAMTAAACELLTHE